MGEFIQRIVAVVDFDDQSEQAMEWVKTALCSSSLPVNISTYESIGSAAKSTFESHEGVLAPLVAEIIFDDEVPRFAAEVAAKNCCHRIFSAIEMLEQERGLAKFLNEDLDLVIDGHRVVDGDIMYHCEYGEVRLGFCQDSGWYYQRFGYAGIGNDFERITRRDGQPLDAPGVSAPLASGQSAIDHYTEVAKPSPSGRPRP